MSAEVLSTGLMAPGVLSAETLALTLTAASIGIVHTLAGPDHYLPFVALARARKWSMGKTLGVTLGCGVGHVAGSILLGALGLALGWAVWGMERFEAARGVAAGWLLLGIGVAYGAWGVRRALTDSVTHDHGHDLLIETGQGARSGATTPWLLFIVFLFGPCEPLIPVLMVPAARGNVLGVAWVAGVFAVATLTTMSLVVMLGLLGVSRLRLERGERWAHAAAGATLACCGLAVLLGL